MNRRKKRNEMEFTATATLPHNDASLAGLFIYTHNTTFFFFSSSLTIFIAFSFSAFGFSPLSETLMSRHLEHDYIGLTATCVMERGSDKLSPSPSSSSESSCIAPNLMETELRLGLPGSASGSPQRKPAGLRVGVSSFGKGLEEKHNPLKTLVSGSKRGFSDANLDGSCGSGNGKRVLSEVDLGKKGAVFFSPRGLESNGAAMKEGVASVPQSSNLVQENKDVVSADHGCSASVAKSQVVGWPPIRSFRKNNMASNPIKNGGESEGKDSPGCLYIKVSMEGAPYLRKVDLQIFGNYIELSSALEKMFCCFTIGQCSTQGLPRGDGLSQSRLMDLLHGSEYVLTYEDKDGDWMLVGDVPWEMFTDSCKRLRIMKGSEAIGLAPRAMEKCKNRN